MSYTYRGITCEAFRHTKHAKSWDLRLYIASIRSAWLLRPIHVCTLEDTDPLDVAVQVYWPQIARELERHFRAYFKHDVHEGRQLSIETEPRVYSRVALPPIEILGIEDELAYEAAYEAWQEARV